MGDFLGYSINHFFADDLAAILAGSISMKFTAQYFDLERKLHLFFVKLEFYSILTSPPINYAKTEGLWSPRAIIGPPKFEIFAGDKKIQWTNKFKYLGYWFTLKVGFSLLIEKCMLKIRQRIGLLNSFTIAGTTSSLLRKVLFHSYVLPIFTWLFPLSPLFSVKQQQDLSHFYYTCLERVMYCKQWSDSFFAFFSNEISLRKTDVENIGRNIFLHSMILVMESCFSSKPI